MSITVSGIFRGQNPFILNGAIYDLECTSDPQTEEYFVWIKEEFDVRLTRYHTLNDFLNDWDIMLRTLKHDEESTN